MPAATELVKHEAGPPLEIHAPMESGLACAPVHILAEAQRAAKALKEVIERKPRPVKFNGEHYLEFEDWQTVGQFYGYAVKTGEAVPVDILGVPGAKAVALLYDRTGTVVGGAEAYCLRDEGNWKTKPWFQLASMAQTRAGAKALRNRLAWVVVLAGYRPTPAEELPTIENTHRPPATEYKHVQRSSPISTDCISDAQRKRLYAIYKQAGVTDEQMKDYLLREWDVESSRYIQKADYEAICAWTRAMAGDPERAAIAAEGMETSHG